MLACTKSRQRLHWKSTSFGIKITLESFCLCARRLCQRARGKLRSWRKNSRIYEVIFIMACGFLLAGCYQQGFNEQDMSCQVTWFQNREDRVKLPLARSIRLWISSSSRRPFSAMFQDIWHCTYCRGCHSLLLCFFVLSLIWLGDKFYFHLVDFSLNFLWFRVLSVILVGLTLVLLCLLFWWELFGWHSPEPHW